MFTFSTPLSKITRIETKYISKLKNLGIETVGDLLMHFPVRYDDFSKISKIAEISPGNIYTVEGKLEKFKTVRTWKKKMIISEGMLSDTTGEIRIIWFNQPYLGQMLEAGKEIRVSGKVFLDSNGLLFSGPQWEMKKRRPTHTGRLVPVYPETLGVTSKWLRWKIQEIIKKPIEIQDALPEEILKKNNLPLLSKAIRYIHFPKSEEEYLVARKRFAFEEMFLLQLKSLQVKLAREKEQAVPFVFNEKLIKDFVSGLPFTLTDAQRKSAFQILKDLEKTTPMNRLLNGDVGSGKTLVAAIGALAVASSGYQTAILAPTEVLARQHYETFLRIFNNYKINIALLTNSYRELNSDKTEKKISRDLLLEKLKSGEIDILIGTHALIQKDVRFKNLALVIIDEQHRFGVAQRAYLQSQAAEINDGLAGKIPHLLSMTATPIPRTLALSFFGNLDLSLLDEMPKNRKTIITQIIAPENRKDMYWFIENQIKASRQAFIILPLVEESEKLADVKAAIAEHKRLQETVFPKLKIGLLHGRLKSKEKEEAMKKMKNKETDILVATSVVEVGIDVPNATVIVIEDADRFGLSQLHQFRGRVGRGENQSYCFLISSADSQKRLRVMEKYSSGFDIAEKDLELRGPGEFLGTAQSGLPDIAMENMGNIKLVKISREEAYELLKKDPDLHTHSLLKNKLESLNRNIHLE